MDISTLFSKFNLYFISAVLAWTGALSFLFFQTRANHSQALQLEQHSHITLSSLESTVQFHLMMELYGTKTLRKDQLSSQDTLRDLFSQWRKSVEGSDPELAGLFVKMGRELDSFFQIPPGSVVGSKEWENLETWIHQAHEQHVGLLETESRILAERQNTILNVILALLVFTGLWLLFGYLYLSKNILRPLSHWYRLLRSPSEPQSVEGPKGGEDLRQLDEYLKKTIVAWPEASESLGIIRSMTEGLLVVSPEGMIKSANRSMEQMLGYERDELTNLPFTHIYVKLKSVHVQGFFKRKTTWREEELFKTKEGNVIPVRFSSSFLFDTNMDVTGFICIAKDITKEKQVEEELLKQSEWFKVTLASIGDAVITTNTEGMVTYMNDIAENLTGWSTDEARDCHVNDVFKIVFRIDRKPLPMPSGKDLGDQTGSFRVHDLMLIHRSGKEIPVDKSTAPIRSGDGELHGAVVVFRDVTELRRAAEELHAAKERAEAAALAKDRFLANLSHEIRTPMNGVIGMTDLLLDSQLSTEQRDSAELVRGSAESLLALINDILDFSKIEAGKLELEHLPFQLRTCIEEVGDLLAQKAHEKGLEMPILVGNDVPITMVGDSGRLRQILLNLINNAVKFTEAGQIFVEVRLKAASQEHYVIHFDIIDTGIGIPPEKLNRLFKPFSQIDATMSRKYGGTGLGLAICRELTEAMGGTISVKSLPGEGAEFTFNLKLGRPADEGSNRIIIPSKLQGMRILLVDPHSTNRQALRYYLEEAGCAIEETAFPDDALNHIKSAHEKGSPFQLVLLDFFLAGMDQFLENMKAAHGSNIILTTSMLHRKAAAHATPQLARHYLTKPVKAQRLYKAMLSILDTEPSQETKPVAPVDDGLRRLKLKFGSPKILVVDDNMVNQKVAVRLVEKQGYRCDVACNGLEALEALDRISYGLILMDCQMPEMDGFQATKRIRARTDDKKSIPIVAMTANAMKGDREYCLHMGMDDYLSKPVNKKELARLLEQYVPVNSPPS